MAQLTLTIKDTLLAKEIEAIAAMGGWTADITVDGVTTPNPLTKEQFAKKQVKAWLRNQAAEYANRQAVAAVTVEEDN